MQTTTQSILRATFPIVATLFLLPAGATRAGFDPPIEVATGQYREAVKDFEKIVFRSPYYEGFFERTADALEDASGRLRDAGRRPERFDRLVQRFREMETVHHQTADLFFGPRSIRPCPVTYARLVAAWRAVDYHFGIVANEMQRLASFGGGVEGVLPPVAPIGGCPTGVTPPIGPIGPAVFPTANPGNFGRNPYYGSSPNRSDYRDRFGVVPVRNRPVYGRNGFGGGANLYRLR